MSSLCVVCEMPSNGLHFGVSCCRACAAFFRRTLSLKLKYKCRFSGTCEVIQRNRYSCRHCRFKKCLNVGLRKELVQISGFQQDSLISKTGGFNSYSNQQSVHRIPAVVRNDKNSSINPTAPNVNTTTKYELYSNAQMILKAKIDAIFDKHYNLDIYPHTIPLSVSQQAMIAYTNHSQHWPDSISDTIDESKITDVEQFLSDTYMEIEYFAQFAMSLQPFSQLPKDQKWLLFRNFWPCFYDLDRSFHTCKILGYDINDERTVCLDGRVINPNGYVARLDMVSNLDEEQVQKLMKPSHDLYRELVTYPFKRLKPSKFELLYMVICCMWNIKHIPSVTKETIAVAEQVKNRLAEDVHSYYTYELLMPNYASRLHKMSCIVSAVDKLQERRKEDSEMSRMFNIFKQDIFMRELV